MSGRHDVRAINRAAEELGFTVAQTNGGHLYYLHPSGCRVIGARTPSDHRSVANTLAALRRVVREQSSKELNHE